MKLESIRLCIYPKDVQLITGKSERYSRMLLQKVKEKFSKEEHQFVSIEDKYNHFFWVSFLDSF